MSISSSVAGICGWSTPSRRQSGSRKLSRIAIALATTSTAVLALATIMAPAAKAYTFYGFGSGYRAYDINNAGEIVGSYTVWDPIASAYETFPTYGTTSTSMSVITGLGGALGQGEAFSISQVPSGGSQGHITGYAYQVSGKKTVKTAAAWFVSSSTPTALPNGAGAISAGYGVNTSYSIAGWLNKVTDLASLWTYSTLTSSFTQSNIGPTTGFTWSYGINEAGLVVGKYYDPSTMGTSGGVPVIYTGGTSITYIPIGTYTQGTAYDISNGTSYYVVGEAGPSYFPPGTTPYTHAFIWSSATNTYTELYPSGTDVNSCALGVNDNGDAVGWSQDAAGQKKAVVWPGGGSPSVLASGPGSTSVLATSINNSGDVVGYEE